MITLLGEAIEDFINLGLELPNREPLEKAGEGGLTGHIGRRVDTASSSDVRIVIK